MGKLQQVKVFSATKGKARNELGAHITAFIRDLPRNVRVNTVVRQSSNAEFHCLSIVLFIWRM